MSESKRQNPPNARWWTWLNGGWIKLTLKPGQRLQWGFGQTDSEGWSREYWSWEYVECDVLPRIESEFHEEAMDCDGRLDRDVSLVCPIKDLAAREVYDSDEKVTYWTPEWERMHAGQRDYSAEAAGY